LQTAFFAPTKHLALHDPKISTNISLQAGQLAIELRAHSLARLVECSLLGADVVFSDNYFDLPAGQLITITAPNPAGWDLEKAKSALRVRSVYNTYSST
jgi:beta-mannosidase